MKKIVSFLLSFVMICSTIVLINTSVGAVNITKTMQKNSKFKKLAKQITWYAIADATERCTPKSVTIKNKNSNRLSIAAFTRYNFYSNSVLISKKQLKHTVKNMFGKSITRYKSSGYLTKIGDDYYYGGGDWGNYQPIFRLSKVTKSGKKYTVKTNGYLKAPTYDYYGYFEGMKTKKICSVTINMKKKSSSSYGYIVTSVKYKGTGVGFF